MTEKQLSIVEAHEKGHTVRPYFSKFFDSYFSKGFDSAKAVFAQGDPLLEKLVDQNDSEKKLTPEEVNENLKAYLFSAMEIAERMSQLKNYFGMHGSDIFTKENLDYARTHYISDTGFDNFMTQFFQAITPETETAFIELVNTGGI